MQEKVHCRKFRKVEPLETYVIAPNEYVINPDVEETNYVTLLQNMKKHSVIYAFSIYKKLISYNIAYSQLFL